MDQRNRPADWIDKIDRNTVCGADRKENSAGGGGVSVGPFVDDQPSGVVVPDDGGAVHLSGDDDSPEPGNSPEERPPAVEHLTHRGIPPKPQIERAGRVSPGRDPGNHPKLFTPAGQLVPRDRPFNRRLDHPSIRSIDAPSALSRSWMCS